MASIETSSVSTRLSAASGDRSPSPFTANSAGNEQSKPHASTTSLPEEPVPMEWTARRRRRSETQELKTRVELLGTKVAK